jgi:hypothetical protein
MTTQARPYRSIMGKRLGLGPYGQIAAQTPTALFDITPKPASMPRSSSRPKSPTFARSPSRSRTFTATRSTTRKFDISCCSIPGGMVDFVATGGSTGIAIGASGKLLAVVAKKVFKAISTTAGVIALTWTDTGTAVGIHRRQAPRRPARHLDHARHQRIMNPLSKRRANLTL